MDRMWSEYLNCVKDYDEQVTDKCKEDADGVLVFVSPNLLVPIFDATIKLEGRYLLSDRRCLPHRKLQKVVP